MITRYTFACVYNTLSSSEASGIKAIAGAPYSAEYVQALYNAISEHTATWATVDDVDLLCLTDDPESVRARVSGTDDRGMQLRIERLERRLPGWWAKLELFRPNLYSDRTMVIYMDLDTVILSSLRPFRRVHSYAPGTFWALSNLSPAMRARGLIGSAVMCWPAYLDLSHLCLGWTEDDARVYGGDERYISERLARAGVPVRYLQEVVTGIVSYKYDVRYRGDPPDTTRLVCFHGKPRPHEVLDDEPWMRRYWHKMTGGASQWDPIQIQS